MPEVEKVMGISTDDIEKIMNIATDDIEKLNTLDYPEGTIAWAGTRHLSFGGDYNTDTINETYSNNILYKSSTSSGNTSNFGDLVYGGKWLSGAGSNISRAIATGRRTSSITGTQAMDYVTVGSTGNGTDFGDHTVPRAFGGSMSNGTLLFTTNGSYSYSPYNYDSQEYVTIASTGNGTDAGNMVSDELRSVGSCPGDSRGGQVGGYISSGSPSYYTNEITYITFHTSNDASDFGNLHDIMEGSGGMCSKTRWVMPGGNKYVGGYTYQARMDYVNPASTGNGADFGDENENAYVFGTMSDGTRGEMWGGYKADTAIDSIQYITIASTGNASDAGNALVGYPYNAGTSGT